MADDSSSILFKINWEGCKFKEMIKFIKVTSKISDGKIRNCPSETSWGSPQVSE